MAKPIYFLTIDTETTQDNLVADFAAVISDKKGRIINQCAVLVNDVYTDRENHCLFFDPAIEIGSIWHKNSLALRYKRYDDMLQSGARQIASISAINIWLKKAREQYNPVLTAYNLPFDRDKCGNTQIDLSIFESYFCLWSAAITKWLHTKNYRRFVLDVHAFNAPTKLGNMTFKTNAETMARFVMGMPELQDEPHTALEDIIFYELPILKALIKTVSVKKLLSSTPYNWRNAQVRDWFVPL